MTIVLATKNKGKIKEFLELLKGTQVKTLSLDDFPDLVMPEETGESFEENALLKARSVAAQTGISALADDSGLVVDALGGRPGMFSARYAGPGATDRENYQKLIKELSDVPQEKRTARFRCVIAFVSTGKDNPAQPEEMTFNGTLEGSIDQAPKGEGGFGYDPVFIPDGLPFSAPSSPTKSKKRTLAQFTPEEKNAISHRALALKEFRRRLIKSDV